jgi:hypothetical protein
MQRANSLDMLGRMVEVEAEAHLPGGKAPFSLSSFSFRLLSPSLAPLSCSETFSPFFLFLSLAFSPLLLLHTIKFLHLSSTQIVNFCPFLTAAFSPVYILEN